MRFDLADLGVSGASASLSVSCYNMSVISLRSSYMPLAGKEVWTYLLRRLFCQMQGRVQVRRKPWPVSNAVPRQAPGQIN